MSRNLAASVRARLKQHSDATKQDFNLTLTHFGLERLLYRLFISEYASNFLLKVALLFAVCCLLFAFWYDVPHRPTRDADLLDFGPDDIEAIVAIFRNICQIPGRLHRDGRTADWADEMLSLQQRQVPTPVPGNSYPTGGSQDFIRRRCAI